MIHIARSYTIRGVPAGFRGAKRTAKQRLLLDAILQGTSPDKLEFKSAVWKPAKAALQKESGGKCAYCEAPTAGRKRTGSDEKGGLVAFGDVEHFRPKTHYWWLAHNFENYLFACQVCNQAFKGDQFPAQTPLSAPFTLAGNETSAQLDSLADLMAPDPLDATARQNWEAALRLEDADLADPLHEEPERLFKYKADDAAREVSILPRAGSGRLKKRAESSIGILGLEREELRFARYDVFEIVKTFAAVLSDPGIAPATRTLVSGQLSRQMAATQAFAGMVRYYVNEEWGLQIPVG